MLGHDGDGQVSQPSGRKLKSISAGYFLACGRKPNEKPVCWGVGSEGQLSINNLKSRFRQLAAGYGHVCGIKLNRKPACRGDNTYGQSTPPNRKFRRIHPGMLVTCGHLPDLKVKCWGSDDELIVSTAPKSKLHSMSMDAYGKLACGVRKNKRTVVCWGDNFEGFSVPPSLR